MVVRSRSRQRWVVPVAGLLTAALAVGAAATAGAITPDRGPTAGGTAVSGELSGATTFTAVSAGDSQGLAIGSDGVTYAWGRGAYGQLGNGNTTDYWLTDADSWSPVAVHAPAGVTFTAATVGTHSVALGSDGRTYAWGHGANGELGNGGTESSAVPVPVHTPDGVTFTQVAASALHSLAIGSDGVTYAWGVGEDGQLGNGGTDNAVVPVPVSVPAGVTFTSIGCSGRFSIAIGSDGLTYAWGMGLFGTHGTGVESRLRISTPVPVDTPDGVTFIRVTSGTGHVLAIASDGSLWAWGDNRFGQVGDGTTTNVLRPVRLDTPAGVTFTDIAAGYDHSVAIDSDGRAYAWGVGTLGQVGNGGTAGSLVPVPVSMPGGVTFTQVSADSRRTLALGSDGGIYAWGLGTNGLLGTGNEDTALEPVQVAAPVVESVTFDDIAGTGLRQSGTTWTVDTPPHASGPVDVEVIWSQLDHTRYDLTLDGYTYGSAPVVTQHPASVEVLATGGRVTLTAAAQGDEVPTVQWQQSAADAEDWADVPGATATTLAVDVQEVTRFRAVFTNPLGTAITEPATVTLATGLGAGGVIGGGGGGLGAGGGGLGTGVGLDVPQGPGDEGPGAADDTRPELAHTGAPVLAVLSLVLVLGVTGSVLVVARRRLG